MIEDREQKVVRVFTPASLMNLYASGHIEAILQTIPHSVTLGTSMHSSEGYRIYSGPNDSIEQITKFLDFHPLALNNLLQMIVPNRDMSNTAIQITSGGFINDSDAICCAIALHNRWSLVVDDLHTLRHCSRYASELALCSSIDIFKYWVDKARPSYQTVREALSNAWKRAYYKPPMTHRLYAWWQEYS